jgi:hypothetical protein
MARTPEYAPGSPSYSPVSPKLQRTQPYQSPLQLSPVYVPSNTHVNNFFGGRSIFNNNQIPNFEFGKIGGITSSARDEIVPFLINHENYDPLEI